MSSAPQTDLVARLIRLAERASFDYQSFQLAAQRADIEGHALVGGVLRSISEGHAGKAHGLLTLAGQIGQPVQDGDVTPGYVEAALRRASESEAMSAALSVEAGATLDARQAEDLDAVLNLTATNRQRLERLLAVLSAA